MHNELNSDKKQITWLETLIFNVERTVERFVMGNLLLGVFLGEISSPLSST